MYNNNFNQPFGMGYGTVYNQTKPIPKDNQPLTKEQIAQLRSKGNDFDWHVSQEDIYRSICTHKEKSGESALYANADGTYTCSICGTSFKFFDGDDDEIKRITQEMLNVLETVKVINLDAPNQFTSTFFQFLALLKKVPQLWDIANKSLSKYDTSNYNPYVPMNMYGVNYMGLYNQMTSNPMYGQYAPQYQPQAAPNQFVGQQPNMMPGTMQQMQQMPGQPPMQQYPGFVAPTFQQQPQPGYMNMGYNSPQAAPNPFVTDGMAIPNAVPTNVNAIPNQNQHPQQQNQQQQNNGENVQQKTFNV